MKVSTAQVKALRERSGAGVMECRGALIEAAGDMDKAVDLLKQKCLYIVEKTANRTAKQGLIEAYVHTGGRIGALVEVNCESDFVARTGEFKEMAHNIAMQVAAMAPRFISDKEIPEGEKIEPEQVCLLRQPFIKDPTRTIQDIVNEVIGKVGENIKISRFSRFELGEQ
ncbi:MAG: elongation factor Ts [Chloroflexi bacterium]|nr:elongation factor Ts [Chloroflexota bacterium]